MLHYEGASGLLAYLLSALTNNITETAGSGHPLQYPGLLPSPRALHCLGGTTYLQQASVSEVYVHQSPDLPCTLPPLTNCWGLQLSLNA